MVNKLGKVSKTPPERLLEMRRQDLLQIVSNHEHDASFQNLLSLLGFDWLVSPIMDPSVVEPYIHPLTEEDLALMYYETVCVHPSGLVIMCFLGSQGAGSFGFVLTQENMDTHLNRLRNSGNTMQMSSFDVLVELEKSQRFLGKLLPTLNIDRQAFISDALNANAKVIQLFEHINELHRTNAVMTEIAGE